MAISSLSSSPTYTWSHSSFSRAHVMLLRNLECWPNFERQTHFSTRFRFLYRAGESRKFGLCGSNPSHPYSSSNGLYRQVPWNYPSGSISLTTVDGYRFLIFFDQIPYLYHKTSLALSPKFSPWQICSSIAGALPVARQRRRASYSSFIARRSLDLRFIISERGCLPGMVENAGDWNFTTVMLTSSFVSRGSLFVFMAGNWSLPTNLTSFQWSRTESLVALTSRFVAFLGHRSTISSSCRESWARRLQRNQRSFCLECPGIPHRKTYWFFCRSSNFDEKDKKI